MSMAPDPKNDEGHARTGSADPAATAHPAAAGEPPRDPLVACTEAPEELKEENAELRESSESFAALAERLNRAKRSES
jgi:hypothetical protein